MKRFIDRRDVEIRLHRRPGMDGDYCVTTVQPVASNSPLDCYIQMV